MYFTSVGNTYDTEAYRDMVQQAFPSPKIYKWVLDLLRGGEIYASQLALLLTQTTGLKTLTMGTNTLDSVAMLKRLFIDNSRMENSAGMHPHIISMMQGRLEALYIYQEARIGFTRGRVSLTGFHHLRRIEVPDHWIISEFSRPEEVLPKGVEFLRVYFSAG